jgi:AcrR family transcriptional regulator
LKGTTPFSMTPPVQPHPDSSSARKGSQQARDRILRAAYGLFCRHGLQAVGIDRIVAEAGVAKMTLYRHFRSKDELVLAVLERRDQLWTRDWLMRQVEGRAGTPEARLLAIFDVFDDWFRRGDYEGCLFINSLLETRDGTAAVSEACVMGLASVRSFVGGLAEDAGIRDAEGFARQWQMLMFGCIIAAASGDTQAAYEAHQIATHLLERARRT